MDFGTAAITYARSNACEPHNITICPVCNQKINEIKKIKLQMFERIFLNEEYFSYTTHTLRKGAAMFPRVILLAIELI